MPEALAGVVTPVTPAPAAEGIQPQTSEPAEQGQPANNEAEHQDEEQKRQSRYRRRLDRERERRIAAETELRLLREQSQRQPQQHTQERAAPAPQGDEEPKRESFEDYDQYSRAVARWEARQAAREEREAASKAEAERRHREAAARTVREQQERWEKGVKDARAEFADFEDVVDNDEIFIPEQMGRAIAESAIGPKLAYYLGKNPDEAKRIADLPAREQYAEMVLLERKVRDWKPTRKASNAPEPINPLGGNAGIPNDKPSVNDDLKTWMQKRNREVHGTRKR